MSMDMGYGISMWDVLSLCRTGACETVSPLAATSQRRGPAALSLLDESKAWGCTVGVLQTM
jgi:hypothetical protein